MKVVLIRISFSGDYRIYIINDIEQHNKKNGLKKNTKSARKGDRKL